jgi:hypothetical protein
LTGTPIAGLIFIHPGVQFKPIESDALYANRNFGEIRANLGVETVAVHAEVKGSISKPD